MAIFLFLPQSFCLPNIMHALLFSQIISTHFVALTNGKASACTRTANFLCTAGPLINDTQDNFSFSLTNRRGLFITIRFYRNNTSILQAFVEGTFVNAPIPNLPSRARLTFTIRACLKRWTILHHS